MNALDLEAEGVFWRSWSSQDGHFSAAVAQVEELLLNEWKDPGLKPAFFFPISSQNFSTAWRRNIND